MNRMTRQVKFGQLIITSRNTVVRLKDTGEEVTIPKGSEIVVGFDGVARHIKGRYAQPLHEGTRINGFAGDGVAAMVYRRLVENLPLDEVLEDHGHSLYDVQTIIINALAEIGLYENVEVIQESLEIYNTNNSKEETE